VKSHGSRGGGERGGKALKKEETRALPPSIARGERRGRMEKGTITPWHPSRKNGKKERALRRGDAPGSLGWAVDKKKEERTPFPGTRKEKKKVGSGGGGKKKNYFF